MTRAMPTVEELSSLSPDELRSLHGALGWLCDAVEVLEAQGLAPRVDLTPGREAAIRSGWSMPALAGFPNPTRIMHDPMPAAVPRVLADLAARRSEEGSTRETPPPPAPAGPQPVGGGGPAPVVARGDAGAGGASARDASLVAGDGRGAGRPDGGARAGAEPAHAGDAGDRLSDPRAEVLRLSAEGLSVRQIAARTGLGGRSVAGFVLAGKRAAGEVPCGIGDAWSDADVARLRALAAEGHGFVAIAEQMSRPVHALRQKARRLGIRVGPRNGLPDGMTPWSAEDDETILGGRASGRTVPEIAKALGRTEQAVKARIQAMRGKGVTVAGRAPVDRSAASSDPVAPPPEAPPARVCEVCATPLSKGAGGTLCGLHSRKARAAMMRAAKARKAAARQVEEGKPGARDNPGPTHAVRDGAPARGALHTPQPSSEGGPRALLQSRAEEPAAGVASPAPPRPDAPSDEARAAMLAKLRAPDVEGNGLPVPEEVAAPPAEVRGSNADAPGRWGEGPGRPAGAAAPPAAAAREIEIADMPEVERLAAAGLGWEDIAVRLGLSPDSVREALGEGEEPDPAQDGGAPSHAGPLRSGALVGASADALRRGLAAHLDAVPAGGWTPSGDLALAEGLIGGAPREAVAARLGVTVEEAADRFRRLSLPIRETICRRKGPRTVLRAACTVEGQAALVAELRRRGGALAQAAE